MSPWLVAGDVVCVCVRVLRSEASPPVSGCRNNFSSSILTAHISHAWKQNHLKAIPADWSHAGAASVSNNP